MWQPIETCPPYVTVLLYRLTDLYPVIGCRIGEDGDKPLFMLQENGPEDGEHHQGIFLKFEPTHWLSLDPLLVSLPEKPAGWTTRLNAVRGSRKT